MNKNSEPTKETFIDGFIHYWKRAFDFNGHSCSAEYWWGQIALIIGLIAQYTILVGCYQSMVVSGYQIIGTIGSILIFGLTIWMFLASIALYFRRVTDVGLRFFPATLWLLMLFLLMMLGKTTIIETLLLILMFVIQIVICSQKSDRFAREKQTLLFRAKS